MAEKQASRDGLMKGTVPAGMCVHIVRARARTYTRIANYTNPFGSSSRYHDDNAGVNNIEKWQNLLVFYSSGCLKCQMPESSLLMSQGDTA